MTVNKENRKILKEAIDSAASHLTDKLPQSPRHPTGRNPHAHIATVLKGLLGHSYTECPDKDVPALLDLIVRIRDDPF
jgi:hypothetical protein